MKPVKVEGQQDGNITEFSSGASGRVPMPGSQTEKKYIGKTKVEPKESFPGGATRSSSKGKGRFDLIPWICLFRVGLRYEEGAEIHGDENWKGGQPKWRLFSGAVRHLFQWFAGKRDEDHLAAAVWNIFGLMWFEEKGGFTDEVKE